VSIPATERTLLTADLRAGHAIDRSGTIVDLPFRFIDDAWKANPLGWSRRRQNDGVTGDPSSNTRSARSDQRRYRSDDDRVAAGRHSWDEQREVCLGLPVRPPR
jgi:hypothetical protein